MPPRFSYWTIIAGGLPTAFRAADRDELLPTFTRLKEKQPDAEMKWFARGKLWDSPEDASADNRRRAYGTDRDRGPKGRHPDRHDRNRGDRERSDRGDRDRPRGDRERSDRDRGSQPREARGKDWRPGGEHRDPRQKFKDAKKDRNQRFKAEKFAKKTFGKRPDRRELPSGPAKQAPSGPARRFPSGPAGRQFDNEKPHGDKLARGPRPQHHFDRERPKWSPKPHGDKFEKQFRDRPQGDRKPFGRPKPRSEGDWQGKRGDRFDKPFRDRPEGDRKSFDRPKPRADQVEKRFRGEGERKPWQKPRPEGRGTYRGAGHGDNAWRPKPPRQDEAPKERRPFEPRGFDRDRMRGGGSDDQRQPPRPRGPNREPRPSERPEPTPPPRPNEPGEPPSAPQERGRLNKNKRRNPR